MNVSENRSNVFVCTWIIKHFGRFYHENHPISCIQSEPFTLPNQKDVRLFFRLHPSESHILLYLDLDGTDTAAIQQQVNNIRRCIVKMVCGLKKECRNVMIKNYTYKKEMSGKIRYDKSN